MAKDNKIRSTIVWRISQSAPMGEWVDLSTQARAATQIPALPADQRGTWMRSSHDLLDGVEIKDDGESVSAETFDEFFSAATNPRTEPGQS